MYSILLTSLSLQVHYIIWNRFATYKNMIIRTMFRLHYAQFHRTYREPYTREYLYMKLLVAKSGFIYIIYVNTISPQLLYWTKLYRKWAIKQNCVKYWSTKALVIIRLHCEQFIVCLFMSFGWTFSLSFVQLFGVVFLSHNFSFYSFSFPVIV